MSLSAAHKKDPWRWVQHSRQLLLLSFHRIFTFIIDNVYATIFITSILNIPLFCCLVLPFLHCLLDWLENGHCQLRKSFGVKRTHWHVLTQPSWHGHCGQIFDDINLQHYTGIYYYFGIWIFIVKACIEQLLLRVHHDIIMFLADFFVSIIKNYHLCCPQVCAKDNTRILDWNY